MLLKKPFEIVHLEFLVNVSKCILCRWTVLFNTEYKLLEEVGWFVCLLTQLLLFIDAKLVNKPCFGVGKLNKHFRKKIISGLTSEVCFFAEKYSCI